MARPDPIRFDRPIVPRGRCEADHYEIFRRCGECVLLPAIRESPPDTLIIANGFSCRLQIVQGTGRVPVHLAQVARMTVTA